MATQEPGQQPSLTALPRLEDLPRSGDGYDPDKVREAFDAFRRHSAQLQAQLRVLQAASRSGQSVEPTGHAVRMDALHLIRSAAEFADTVEADAQKASEAQLSKTEEEVRRRRREQQDREAEIERYRQESERQRAEMLNNARNETRELLANANRDATQELREAEAKGNRLLEQARHQATELTNATRAEVEQTLEWARAQAGAILARAQTGTEQLLAAAGLGDDDIKRVGQAIVTAATEATEATRSGPGGTRPAAALAAPPPVSPPSAKPSQAKPAAPKAAEEPAEAEETRSEGSEPSNESQDDATTVGSPRASRRLPVPDRGRIHHRGRSRRWNRAAQHLVDHRRRRRGVAHRRSGRDRASGREASYGGSRRRCLSRSPRSTRRPPTSSLCRRP